MKRLVWRQTSLYSGAPGSKQLNQEMPDPLLKGSDDCGSSWGISIKAKPSPMRQRELALSSLKPWHDCQRSMCGPHDCSAACWTRAGLLWPFTEKFFQLLYTTASGSTHTRGKSLAGLQSNRRDDGEGKFVTETNQETALHYLTH